MDCGLANPGGSGLPQHIGCDDNDNFVYEFYKAVGLPQDPANAYGDGGQFFYVDVPGHPIHWGHSNDCWLRKWVGANTDGCQ
jgi:hypothetical protein